MRELKDVVYVGAVRTPMGRFGGTLKDVPVYQLASFPIREALKRANVAGTEIDDCVIASCRQAGNRVNPAHTAAQLGGVDMSVPGVTINKACPAGMKAVTLAAQLIQVEQANVVLCGGMESMSSIPHLLRGHRFNGFRLGPVTLEDGWSDSDDPIAGVGMGITAENVAAKYDIPRPEMDAFAAGSHNKAAAAQAAGYFDSQITPVIIPAKGKTPEVVFAKDESIRYDASLEAMAKLPGAFRKDGVVTAGNSCGLTDGSCMMVAMTREEADNRGVKPLFSLVEYSQYAAPGITMGEGPGLVIPRALQRAGMTLDDMDLIEINEAFASQVLANYRMLKFDMDKLNICGGAIALGHPTGCSGARIMTTLYYNLQRLDKEYGIASICGGGGATMAAIIKRES